MITAVEPRIRPIRRSDAAGLAAIDAIHTGRKKLRWWEDVVRRHCTGTRGEGAGKRAGFVAVEGPKERVVGFILAQVRQFEFGSEPCGWIFAVGVHPDRLRTCIASALFAQVRSKLAESGVKLLRTMVRKDDVPVLTFFRSRGFVAGTYVELELSLEESRP